MQIEKRKLLIQLQGKIEEELAVLQKSVESAAEAATHPENKPEHKYDTRGLEASYLFGAQTERVSELKTALHMVKSVVLHNFTESEPIAVTALVKLLLDEKISYCFLMAWGAGYSLMLDDFLVLTITPQSPLGGALIGKGVGDLVQVKTSGGTREYEIVEII